MMTRNDVDSLPRTPVTELFPTWLTGGWQGWHVREEASLSAWSFVWLSVQGRWLVTPSGG